MIGDPQPRFGQEVATFISRNVFPFALLALGFATTVAIGAMLAARFVSRSIERVTRLALAIDPAAPQGSISLSQVPRELKPLVEALNRAFGEIDAYIKMQRRFLGNAAHQLRTPLTLLRAKIEDVPEPALKAELVSDVRRLTSLVSAMLDLARLQNHAIEKRPIDLSVVALEVLADFSPSALDSGIELALEQVEEGPFIVQGGRGRDSQRARQSCRQRVDPCAWRTTYHGQSKPRQHFDPRRWRRAPVRRRAQDH